MKMSEKLIYLRKEKRLSQMELAEEVHVSRQAVSRWEMGDGAPSTENLKCLCNCYYVSVNTLLDDEVNLPEESERTPEEDIPIKTERTKRKVSNQAVAAVCFLLVAVILLICIVIRLKENVEPVSNNELQTEEDFSSDGSFSLGW